MPVCRACGVRFVETVDPYDITGMVNVLQEAKKRKGVRVVIAREMCVISARWGWGKTREGTRSIPKPVPGAGPACDSAVLPSSSKMRKPVFTSCAAGVRSVPSSVPRVPLCGRGSDERQFRYPDLVGIGGQGTILASNILGEACLIEGRHVKGAETHGMAQRGGSVESHIRIDGQYGPRIAPGQADLLISFDLLEALRYSHYLKRGCRIVANSHLVLPTSVYTQKLPAPTEGEIIAALKNNDLCLLDADRIATGAGSPLSQNVVMLGASSRWMPLETGNPP